MKWVLLTFVGAALAACLLMLWAVCRASGRADAAAARIYILPMDGHREDAEWLLRRVAWRWQWGMLHATQVRVVDLGMDADTADTVSRLCTFYGFEYVSSGTE